MPADPSPLVVAWSMCASACLMMALMHLLLWFKERRSAVYLLGALMATAASINAVSELSMMLAADKQTYANWLNIQVYAVFLLILSLVWFIYLYFGTASRAIALTISAMYFVHLALHVASPNGIVFSEISFLQTVSTYWGEMFTIARGDRSAWNAIADLASPLILIYIAHASFKSVRVGNRHRALVVGGAAVLFILLAGIHTPLVDAGLVRTPYLISFAFLAIVAAMTYELVSEAFLASRYARDIKAGERRWQTLVETVPVFVVGLDREGRIIFSNTLLRKVSGYTEDELLGMRFTDFLPDDEFERGAKLLRDALDAQAPSQERMSFLNKQGARRVVVWSSGAVTDSGERVTGVLSIGADVTDRARAQVELQRTRRELDRLTRATLLGEVAAGLAHELNQPLTAILSNAQAARRVLSSDSPNLDELRLIIDDVIVDDKRAANVVHGLRAFLRKGEPVRRPVDLNQIVHKVIGMLSAELQAQEISLAVDLAKRAPLIHADEVQIQQVIMNLVLNAIKAMNAVAAGERRLTIQSEIVEGVVRVSVIDRGPGIDTSLLPRLFDPFVTTGDEGLGMGLAICRRIVEAHGGRISAVNGAHGGAVFSFTLPLNANLKVAR